MSAKHLIHWKKRGTAILLAITVGITASITACTSAETFDTETNISQCPYEEYIEIDVFDSQANFQGIQSGWFGKVVKDKFNMSLNIIAPNVSGGGDTLFEIRAAAGNLGDLVIFNGSNGMLQNLVNAGLLYDMEELLEGKQIHKYELAIEDLNGNISQGGIYAIPSELSMNSPEQSAESLELNYGPYIRWDLYKKLGYPKLQTLEDLLPVLSDMQKLIPETESGEKTYAFSFFKDWDASMMNAVKQPCCLYGYDEYGFVLAKADGSDFQSIIEDNSIYVRMCKFLFEANQIGLVDPESVTQSYEECFNKYRDGRVFYSPWPWLGQSAYNTAAHINQGEGFMFAPVEDLQVYSYGCNIKGSQKCVIGIGSQAKDPKRLADFIDWLYSDEGISVNGAQLAGATAGPQGLTWEMGEDGPYLTEFGKQALLDREAQVPESEGGGSWTDGTSALNFKSVTPSEKSENGYYFAYEMWDSVQELNSSPLLDDWKSVMNAKSTREYLEKNNMLLVAPGCSYQAPVESSEQQTIRSQCKKAIQEYSWSMVFADNEEEFYSLLSQMQDAVKSYGYDSVIAYDLEHAKAKAEAAKQNVKEYNEIKEQLNNE